MLRKGIVALMITVMSVGGVGVADEKKSSTLMDFIRGPAIGRPNHQHSKRSTRPHGVTHAVVADAEKQVPEVRQTSNEPEQGLLQPAESAPQPLPVQYAPNPHTAPQALPPQYYSEQGQPTPQVAYYDNSWTPAPPPSGGGAPVHFVSNSAAYSGNAVISNQPYGAYSGGSATHSGGNSPGAMYPAPLPGIPEEVGGTTIPHEAFHPHEMLHAHRYKAMYGPYYYKVHGGWILTPFGVWSKENWKLKGTTVDVKYKSHISKFSMFHPPVIR